MLAIINPISPTMSNVSNDFDGYERIADDFLPFRICW